MKLDQAADDLRMKGSGTRDDSFFNSFDDDSKEEGGGLDTTSPSASESERDEVQEVHKTTQSETRRLHIWRGIVTFVLLLTALAVTLTTYKLLKSEQHDNFETAVSTALSIM